MNLYRLLTEIFVLLDDADNRVLGQHNLTVRQFYALYHLDRERGMSINELSARLLCGKSNTTRLVERLKQDGLVVRERDTTDRRYVCVRLTDAGVQLRQQAMAIHQESVERRFENLSAEAKATLHELLTLLRDDLRRQLN